ncbi:hypothetical protein VKT23_000697 [Stygiomarasmius scandens]|uniref:Uncharacterized protein n=1 Tax=Marasmiellus scandens TaxID=2682957 RepID=A0ABR1K531_9AGAR
MDDWSPSDRDLFFRALARYSRLRPDLIALDIKSKSYTDVCLYLDALQCAATQEGHPELRRDELDIAMEVSHDWISFEEQKAAALIAADITKNEDVTEDTKQLEDVLQTLTTRHLMAMGAILQEGEDLILRDASMKNVLNKSDEPMEARDTTVPELLSPHGTSTDPTLNLQISPSALRRLKKRLYMRKRRAEATGTEVNTDATRLCPGRRSKAAVEEELKEYGEEEQENEENMEGNEEEGNKTRKKRKKILELKQELENCGIDYETLLSNDLGFFHLDTLARLMKGYRQSYASSSKQLLTSMSSNVLHVFNAIVIDFATELVHRSIIFKEQEMKIKSDTKAWGSLTREVSIENIKRALSVMKARRSITPSYPEISDDDEGAADKIQPEDEEIEGSEDQKDPSFSFQQFHDAPPYLPSHLLFKHDDPLMSMENDNQEEEERLLQELDEENDLDEQDCDLEMRYEEELWSDEYRLLESSSSNGPKS